MDCGGSCPPCADAPSTRNIRRQSWLKQNNYALNDIIVTDVSINPSNEINFFAGESVVFGPGFSMKENSSITANITKDHTQLTRNFTHECFEEYNVFTPNGDGRNETFCAEFVGYLYAEMHIYNARGIEFRYLEFSIDADGTICNLWNGRNKKGKDAPDGAYFVVFFLTNYKGEVIEETCNLTLLR